MARWCGKSGRPRRSVTRDGKLVELSAATHRFCDIDVNGHRVTCPIRSTGFQRWLARRFFLKRRRCAQLRSPAIDKAKAHFDAAAALSVSRVGGLDGRLYLDLTDDLANTDRPTFSA